MRVAVVVVAAVALLGATLAGAGAGAGAARRAEVRAPEPAAAITIKYRVDGVSRIARLQSDLAIGPGTLDAEIDLVSGTISGDLWLPPSDGYFIAFGFVPTTARTELIPVGKVTGTITAGRIKANSRLDIGLGDVAVDRRPLDVGRTCRTVEPASIDLEGPFDLNRIPMKGVYAIPAFGGCQGRERLDPLMTGLVSGQGNTIDLTLTALPATGLPTAGLPTTALPPAR